MTLIFFELPKKRKYYYMTIKKQILVLSKMFPLINFDILRLSTYITQNNAHADFNNKLICITMN